MLINHLILAKKQKWPCGSKNIIIQHDNAKPHSLKFDNDLMTECYNDGWNIKFRYQPPNSPDLNVLDLGFFNSMQALQQQKTAQNIDDLIAVVQEAYENVSMAVTNNIFLSLQIAMASIMNCAGKNNYKLEHMAKQKLLQTDRLNVSIHCNIDTVAAAQSLLDSEKIC